MINPNKVKIVLELQAEEVKEIYRLSGWNVSIPRLIRDATDSFGMKLERSTELAESMRILLGAVRDAIEWSGKGGI